MVIEPATGGGASLFLERALGIGEPPAFRVEVHRADRLPPAALDEAAVVVLNDVAPPAGDAGRRLAERVEQGAGLLVVAGERFTAGSGPAAALVAPSPGPAADRSGRGGVLAWHETGHPAFLAFASPRSGTFTGARFYRARQLVADSATTVLARFGDGSPALTETRHGQGAVLVWATTMDRGWNDLPVQPAFVPFVHGLVSHLAGRSGGPPWFTVGQSVAVADTLDPVALTAISPSGRRGTAGVLALAERGFYEVRAENGGRSPRVVASNIDLAELDLARIDPEELAAELTSPRREAVAQEEAGEEAAAAVVAGGGESAEAMAARERRQSLWWYALLAALLLLAAEPVLAGLFGRGRRTDPIPGGTA